ncbi:hypothetical protein DBA29_03560 [Xenophilus aerolatus]|nr:hypothetical protein [Xenophilus aerolatus]
MDFDPEMFGKAVGEMIRDAVEPLHKRIEGMQAKLDKCLSFAGEWQSALDYPKGSLVRRGDQFFVATKHQHSGGSLSGREGSGWEKIF